MHKLYLLPSNNLNFKSSKELDLSISHLFYNNKNIETLKNNYFLLGEISENIDGLFIEKNQNIYYNRFKNLINKNVYFKNIILETFYCVFYFIMDSYLITNIIKEENDRIFLTISDDILNSLNENNNIDLIEELEDLLNNKQLKLINYSNCDKTIRFNLEKTILIALHRQFPIDKNNLLINISHNNEPNILYHVHRMIKKY